MSRSGCTGRSLRPAAVGRAGPFRPEEHTFFPSHSARRASFHYGKNDSVLSGIGTDRPARRRPAAAAARCAGRARGGRPMTGRCAKNDRDSATEGAVREAAELLQGQWNGRQARAVSRMKQLRVRAGRGVLRKQAENAVEDTTDRTAEREM